MFAKIRAQELAQVFDELDVDKNGTLDSEEVRRGFAKLGLQISENELERLFLHMDKDHNGVVDAVEWQEMLLLAPTQRVDDIFRYWADATSLGGFENGFVNVIQKPEEEKPKAKFDLKQTATVSPSPIAF